MRVIDLVVSQKLELLKCSVLCCGGGQGMCYEFGCCVGMTTMLDWLWCVCLALFPVRVGLQRCGDMVWFDLCPCGLILTLFFESLKVLKV